MLASIFATTREERFAEVFRRYLPGETTTGENHFSPTNMTTLLSTLYQRRNEIPGYEKIIELMSERSFHYRLHTENTRNYLAGTIGSNDPYFHDVGIFFRPNQPYILSVMTYQVPSATSYISDVSDLVWQAKTFFND